MDARTAAGERTLYNKAFPIMGGQGSLRFVDDRGGAAAEALASRAMEETERIERKYSRYLESSLISRINRSAGRTPVAVDEETVALVEEALSLARGTQGAFDPTSGVLRRVWNWKGGRVPDRREIDALLPLVNYRDVSVSHGTVFLRREGMELDLGGVGKEYAADRAARVLRDAGVESAIVNLGGDVACVRARGDGKPWKIGILDPRDRERCRFSVRLSWDGGVATSGDYERCFVHEGRRYHHILDARTGWPARGIAAVTVVAPDAFRAGLAASASFLLGPEDGLRYLEHAEGIEGALITEAGEMRWSEGMLRCSDLPGSFFARYPAV
jgi:thiamine biosynthesis lipoprotein